MRVAAIDAATRRATVALWEDGRTVASRASEEPALHAEKLLGLVTGVFVEAGWAKGSVDVIACGIGPGSFTGVRVGMATAKGLALAWEKPIVGVGSLAAMAAALPTGHAGVDGIVALLDARKSEVFVAVYDPRGAVLAAPSHLAADRIQEKLAAFRAGRLLAVGEATSLVDLGPTTVYRSRETDLPDAATIARVGGARAGKADTDDVAALEPFYVRPPDVTMPKR